MADAPKLPPGVTLDVPAKLPPGITLDTAAAPSSSTATGTYDTTLTPAEETAFGAWKQQYAPKDSGDDYDLRGAFKANLTPDQQTGHWPDTYKKPNHPTFSDQSMYAKGENAAKAGRWEGDTFVPPTPAAKPAPAVDAPAARVPVNPKAEIAAPILNFLDYPIRDAAARVVGAVKGAIPRDEKTREAFYREYDKSLPYAAIPETESDTGKAISTALGIGGKMVGGIADAFGRWTIGDTASEAVAPYAGLAMDAAPVAGARRGAARGAAPRPGMAPRPEAAAARTAGYKLPPEEISAQPSEASKVLSGESGKYKKFQDLSEDNQLNTNRLAAKGIGLPEGTRLTKPALDRAKQPAINAYEAVKTAAPNTVLGASQEFRDAVDTVGVHNATTEQWYPNATKNPKIAELREELLQHGVAPTSVVMDRMQRYRAEAGSNLKANSDAATRALGVAQLQAADVLENAIERSIGYTPARVALFAERQAAVDQLTRAQGALSGKGGMAPGGMPAATERLQRATEALQKSLAAITPEERVAAQATIKRFTDARQLFAKIYDLEKVVNPATGDVSAHRLAALRGQWRRPMTGEMKQIADAAAAFPKDTQTPSTFGRTEAWSILDLAAMAHGGPMAAVPMLRRPARALMRSDFWQNRMFNRSPAVSSAGSGGAAGSVIVPHNEDDPLARAMDY